MNMSIGNAGGLEDGRLLTRVWVEANSRDQAKSVAESFPIPEGFTFEKWGYNRGETSCFDGEYTPPTGWVLLSSMA